MVESVCMTTRYGFTFHYPSSWCRRRAAFFDCVITFIPSETDTNIEGCNRNDRPKRLPGDYRVTDEALLAETT